MTRLKTCLLPIAITGCLASLATVSLAGTEPSPASTFPLSIDNCGITATYRQPPARAFTMNQSATEIMLALGLQDRMIGTAFLDDAVLDEFSDAYQAIPYHELGYPSREVLFKAKPDFVYASYPSAFEAKVDGMVELLQSGVPSYLSPSRCEGREAANPAPLDAVYEEIRDIGRIFGVLPRAETLIASYQAELAAIRDQIGVVDTPVRVLWYDSGAPPFVGACCGTPNEILRLAGAQNVFPDVRGSWATVSWDDVLERKPDVVVLVNSSWSPASQKREWLSRMSESAGLDAAHSPRFVTIDFSGSTPGIRNIAAVRKLAESLYPERFGQPRRVRLH